MLIDTHCHLDDERFKDIYKEIISSLPENNIGRAITIGTDGNTSKAALDIARQYEHIYCTLGTHPHESKDMTDDDLEFYRTNALDSKVVAIGEVGLDFHYDFSPRDIQQKAFIKQIELSCEVNLPLVVHTREAYDLTLNILDQYKNDLINGVLIHCYTGGADYLREFLSRGFYVSFGGAITYKNNHASYEAVMAADLERVLLETDCPYLAPVPLRGTLNQPKNIVFTAQKIAEWRGIELAEVEKITTQNAFNFFRKMK